jgi:hypothetical protein
MDETYVSVVAQVIPVLLLTGAVEMRASMPASMRVKSNDSEASPSPQSDLAVAEEDLNAHIKHLAEIDALVARYPPVRLRRNRYLGSALIPVMWFGLFVLPVLGLVGEITALIDLRYGRSSGLVFVGASASVVYVGGPLLMRFIDDALLVSSRLWKDTRHMDTEVNALRAKAEEYRGLIEQAKALSTPKDDERTNELT